MLWVEKSTVAPRSRCSTTISFSRSTFSGSRPENGSSRISSSGRCSTVLMNWTFCCIPRDSSSTFLSAQPPSPSRSSQRLARSTAVPLGVPLSSARKTRVSLTFIFVYRPRSSGR